MTISIDFNSPVIRIPGYETKYDFAGASNSFIRLFNDYLQARIIQQFHFWLWMKKGGVVLRGVKWIYKALRMLQEEAIVGFSEYQIRKAIALLVAQGILVREQLHREHYGAVHACAAYNRQYYYRIDYEVLELFIQSKVKEFQPNPNQARTSQAENTETVGFVKVAEQVREGQKTDLRMSQNHTDTTFKTDRSETPPPAPQGERESNQGKTFSQIPKGIQEEQEQSNPTTVEQKEINFNTTPFATVVQRTPRVEQKINKDKPVQKPVQVPDVPEAVQVEVMPPGRDQRKPRTRKGTKPNNDFGLAPWKSLEQFGQFYRALVRKLPIVANSRSPQGLAHQIINQLKSGIPHSYWDDFVNGLPIGTSTQQEWEVEPGVAHPMFVEYLAEKLIKGNNSQTREQAIANALDIVSSPKQAIFFWKECKISLGNALHEAERHRALGVQALPTPLWTKERPEPTLEEAAIAGTKIALINSSTENAIEAAQNRQIEGSTGQIEPSTHNTSNTSLESDPWLDEVKPPQKRTSAVLGVSPISNSFKKPRISDFASEDFKRKMGLGEAEQTESKSESKKRYAQPDEWRRQPLRIEEMNFAEINKALLDPILRDELTPQLMLSDYELITDEMGRILRIEKPPE